MASGGVRALGGVEESEDWSLVSALQEEEMEEMEPEEKEMKREKLEAQLEDSERRFKGNNRKTIMSQ